MSIQMGNEGETAVIEGQEKSPARHERIGESCRLFLTAYLVIIFVGLPLFMQDGYSDIGNLKFYFYRDVSLGALCILTPLTIFYLFTGGYRFRFPDSLLKLSAPDWFVALYGISVLLSFFFSVDKREALWGADGWNMGLFTQLLFVAFYFLISRLWEYSGSLPGLFLGVSCVVFLLAILNRFSVYPIVLPVTAPSFLSTIGNINWLSGYWAVAFPIGTALYWLTEIRWLRAVSALFVLIGCGAGVCQGSSSAFLVFGGLFLLLFLLSASGVKRMKRFLEIGMLFCISCLALRLIRWLAPDAYNYYTGNLSDWLTSSGAALLLFVLLAALYLGLFLFRLKLREGNGARILRQTVILAVVLAVGVYLALALMNTMWGIGPLAHSSAFVLDEQWGSSRAGTWKDGAAAYARLRGINKLFGVGPDCFASYIYSVPELAARVTAQFGDSRLTNAHNEWLSMLVNGGAVGLACYAGIFISAMARYFRRGTKEPALFALGTAVMCYTLHNMVSFQQVLSTPFLFLLMGMGEGILREKTVG